MRYRMSDVVTEIKEREDNPPESQYDRFVGLEHYASGEVVIKKYGSTAKLGSSMKVFHTGDILIARRNVYLKRASVVFFDGLTSGDSIVLRAKDERIGRLLPFVFNTDDFWDFADRFSDGTMSKRLSPKTLMQYEFDLPDEDKQDELAGLLWAAIDVRDAYYDLFEQTEELVKSQFIELFDHKYPTITAEKACEIIVDCPHATPKYDGDELNCPAIRTSEIVNGEIEWTSMKYVSKEECEKRNKRLTPEAGDIVYAREGSYGDCVILPAGYDFCLGQRTMLFRPNRRICTSEYLHQALRSDDVKRQADEKNNGITVPHVNVADAKQFYFPLPPLEDQMAFGEFVIQSDKSKFELQQAINNITTVIKSIIQQDFSGSLNGEC